METYYINKELNWRVEHRADGWHLFNEFGYAGTFASLTLALSADSLMGVEPTHHLN